jgi:hypothetical protein
MPNICVRNANLAKIHENFFILFIYIMVKVNPKKIMKETDGMYHINGKKFETLIAPSSDKNGNPVNARLAVMRDNAYKTKSGLTKNDLMYSKSSGKIVSKAKSEFEKKFNRLNKSGYALAKKGKFGTKKLAGGRRKNKTSKRKSKGQQNDKSSM